MFKKIFPICLYILSANAFCQNTLSILDQKDQKFNIKIKPIGENRFAFDSIDYVRTFNFNGLNVTSKLNSIDNSIGFSFQGLAGELGEKHKLFTYQDKWFNASYYDSANLIQQSYKINFNNREYVSYAKTNTPTNTVEALSVVTDEITYNKSKNNNVVTENANFNNKELAITTSTTKSAQGKLQNYTITLPKENFSAAYIEYPNGNYESRLKFNQATFFKSLINQNDIYALSYNGYVVKYYDKNIPRYEISNKLGAAYLEGGNIGFNFNVVNGAIILAANKWTDPFNPVVNNSTYSIGFNRKDSLQINYDDKNEIVGIGYKSSNMNLSYNQRYFQANFTSAGKNKSLSFGGKIDLYNFEKISYYLNYSYNTFSFKIASSPWEPNKNNISVYYNIKF